MDVLDWLAIGALGALGALARWGLMAIARRARRGDLLGVVIANTVGSFAAGVLLVHPVWWAEPVAIGVLGALTTFSTIAQGMAVDLESGRGGRFVRALLVHLVTGLGSVLLGFTLGSAW